jgi:hypothetical protein
MAFDGGLFDRLSAFHSGVHRLAVGVLHRASRFIHHPFQFGVGVAGNFADAFLHLATDIADGAGYSIISHECLPCGVLAQPTGQQKEKFLRPMIRNLWIGLAIAGDTAGDTNVEHANGKRTEKARAGHYAPGTRRGAGTRFAGNSAGQRRAGKEVSRARDYANQLVENVFDIWLPRVWWPKFELSGYDGPQAWLELGKGQKHIEGQPRWRTSPTGGTFRGAWRVSSVSVTPAVQYHVPDGPASTSACSPRGPARSWVSGGMVGL